MQTGFNKVLNFRENLINIGCQLDFQTGALLHVCEVDVADTARIIKMKTTTKTEKPPLPYGLTNLQRDANKYYGFIAQQTLDYTQSLYKKKLVTYPRTDSRYLTDDMDDSTARLCSLMKG